MAKFNCTCGNTLSNVGWPAPCQAILITHKAVDDFTDYSQKSVIFGNVPRREIWECDECGRLWIQKKWTQKEYNNEFVSFLPETERLKYGNDDYDGAKR